MTASSADINTRTMTSQSNANIADQLMTTSATRLARSQLQSSNSIDVDIAMFSECCIRIVSICKLNHQPSSTLTRWNHARR